MLGLSMNEAEQEEASTGEEIDEANVALIMDSAGVSREVAIRALSENNNEVVNALCSLTVDADGSTADGADNQQLTNVISQITAT